MKSAWWSGLANGLAAPEREEFWIFVRAVDLDPDEHGAPAGGLAILISRACQLSHGLVSLHEPQVFLVAIDGFGEVSAEVAEPFGIFRWDGFAGEQCLQALRGLYALPRRQVTEQVPGDQGPASERHDVAGFLDVIEQGFGVTGQGSAVPKPRTGALNMAGEPLLVDPRGQWLAEDNVEGFGGGGIPLFAGPVGECCPALEAQERIVLLSQPGQQRADVVVGDVSKAASDGERFEGRGEVGKGAIALVVLPSAGGLFALEVFAGVLDAAAILGAIFHEEG